MTLAQLSKNMRGISFYQISEHINAMGNCTGNKVIDLSLGNAVTATLTGNGTWSFSNPPPSGVSGTVTIYLTNGGAFTITWSPALKWPGGIEPVLAAAGLDIITLTTLDGGASWSASLAQDEK